jgi:hypothetical protein
MSPDQWKKLQAAFAEALAMDDPAERAAFVAGLRASDADLAGELQRMLDADITDDDELLEPVQAIAASLGNTATDRWTGKTLGNYRLTHKIAVGGMSAVYFGKRVDEQFDQDVAIKIVAGSILSDDLNMRFRTERQILASLRHEQAGYRGAAETLHESVCGGRLRASQPDRASRHKTIEHSRYGGWRSEAS